MWYFLIKVFNLKTPLKPQKTSIDPFKKKFDHAIPQDCGRRSGRNHHHYIPYELKLVNGASRLSETIFEGGKSAEYFPVTDPYKIEI